MVEPLLAALSSVAARQLLTEIALASLKEALSSNRVVLYETASSLVAYASAFDARAAELITTLSQSARADERHNAILCLTQETPTAITFDVLARTLGDKSSKVRTKAADWILRLRLVQAIPLLEQALRSEKHAESKRTMEFSLRILRDGYMVEPHDDKTVWLTLALNGKISGQFVERGLITQRGIANIVSELVNTTKAS